jgi:DNA replication and repair protein RecF
MELISLSLTNYRNFASLELDVPSGLVVLSGENAQGKSNLLEAVYLLAVAKSYRATAEREMVSWSVASQGGFALVGGSLLRQDGKLEIRLGLQCDAGASSETTVRKRIQVNGIARRASELVGLVNAVLFSADDMEMVFGAPAIRRRYLDVMLCQVSRPYLRALQRYQRVLTQRNHLLRSLRDGHAQENELALWDDSLCAQGAAILEGRYQALARLVAIVQETYQRVMGSAQRFSVEYVSAAPPVGEPGPRAFHEAMAEALVRSRSHERAVAYTVVGPHRDDLRLSVEGVEMARHASRGQARLAALALRLAEGQFITERRGEPPILLLDDVLSELDDHRRDLVLEEARRYPQALVTTTNPSLLPDWCRESAHYFRVSQGQVTRE